MTRKCPYCKTELSFPIFAGYFIRLSDRKRLRRFKCNICCRQFSQATFHRCYRQKKRRLNPRILELLASGVSKRRIAKLLHISRTTVSRKAKFLGKWARVDNAKFVHDMPLVHELQFDDLETFEHSKLKPLSVTMAVEKGSRKILAIEVSRMPAKGLLVERSLKKYGPRLDERPLARNRLFSRIQNKIVPQAKIQSDANPHYPAVVRKYFPAASHLTTLGDRSCITGQGELKATEYDPLFSLNHTFAMLRANISRLIRRTWCTTKKAECLSDHLEIYAYYHNYVLLKKRAA